MKRSIAVLLPVALAFATSFTFAADRDGAVSTPAQTLPIVDDDNKVVCRREHVIGSTIPRKICRTKAEQRALQEASKRTIEEMQRGSSRNLPRDG